MPVLLRTCDDRELIILAGTENLKRRDMHPLDEARLFAVLRPATKGAGGSGGNAEAAIALELNVSRRTIFRRLALLRLVPEAQEALRTDKITLQLASALS